MHEIRNPLATISLALEHIKTLEQLPPGGRKRADLAGAEVTRLERLLADILVYAKPLTLERSAVDLVGLVEETVAAESVEAAEFQVRSAPCPAVAADTDRLRQVLINLLRNARQASPAGSPVSIRCEPLGTDRVEVEIANQGEPIPEEKLERVFEPFFTSKGGGTGLGLAIVRRIVSAHGGEITLESDEKSGTRAKLRLPIMADASDADRDQAAVEAG